MFSDTLWSAIKLFPILVVVLAVSITYSAWKSTNPGEKQPDKGASLAAMLGSLEAKQESTAGVSREVVERLTRLESIIANDKKFDERTQIAKSEKAVRVAQQAALASQAKAATRDLGQLKKRQAQWAALEEALLKTEAGKRIAASPKHLQRVLEIWQRERPTLEQMVEWETQLNALSEPIEQADEESTLSVTSEHVTLLEDLGKKLASQSKNFEQQAVLLAAIQAETSELRPGDVTLVTALERHHSQLDKAEWERITAAGKAARTEAEKEHAAKIAALERQIVEANAKREEQRIQGEKSRLEQLAQEEQKQIAEEARIQDLKSKATLAGLKDEATRVEEGLRWAQLEREMARDMKEIQGLLVAFTAPGFMNRGDDSKGPASFSKIKSAGALEPSRKGLQALFFMATGKNDRPIGGLPPGVGGHISDATSTVPIERAQSLLKKYGELMVRKEMLAP